MADSSYGWKQFIAALAWPVVAAAVVAAFYSPLRDLLAVLPETLTHTTTVTVAGVTLRLNRSIASRATTEVVRALKDADVKTVQFILANEMAGVTLTEGEEEFERKRINANLVNGGLCRFLDLSELQKEAADRSRREKRRIRYSAGIECGDTYSEVRAFLQVAAWEAVEQIRSQLADKKS